MSHLKGSEEFRVLSNWKSFRERSLKDYGSHRGLFSWGKSLRVQNVSLEQTKDRPRRPPPLKGDLKKLGVSLVAQTVKNLLAMRETPIQSLGQEDPLEEEMATHSSILTWRIPWTKEPGRLQSTGSQRVSLNWAADTFTFWRNWRGNAEAAVRTGQKTRKVGSWGCQSQTPGVPTCFSRDLI